MKRILNLQGQPSGSPKDTFRKAAIEELINDPELWFGFQDIRNITVHTYDEENMELVIKMFDSFSVELNKLINKLEQLGFKPVGFFECYEMSA